jgi:hypothetical protein
MTSHTVIKNINAFVVDFLIAHCSSEVVEQWNSKQNQKRYKKKLKTKKRRGGKPKRAKTAYLYFCIDPDNRAEAKNRLDDEAKNTDVVREVAKMWKKLKTSDDDDDIARKTRYHELASKDKERYDDEKQSCSPVVPKVNRSIVRVKSSTGYRSFIKNRKEFISNETPDAKNVMAIIKEEWNTMSEEEKQSWEASVGVVAGAVPY